MKHSILSLVVGFLFSLGLGVSGMTEPQRVIGFLDIFGSWDPSLLFVMFGAIGVHLITYRIIRKRHSPLILKEWHVPTKKDLTPSLVIGSSFFGMGWGLAGLCPGPALVSLASFEIRPVVFILSMLVGMFIFQVLNRKFQFKR